MPNNAIEELRRELADLRRRVARLEEQMGGGMEASYINYRPRAEEVRFDNADKIYYH